MLSNTTPSAGRVNWKYDVMPLLDTKGDTDGEREKGCRTQSDGIQAGASGEQSDETDVKHELKHAIQSRRVARGLSVLEFSSSSQKKSAEELTPDEEQKRRIRRERNKLAASKCRERKKLKSELLTKESKELEGDNRRLESDIFNLRAERDALLDELRNHSCALTAHQSCVPSTETPAS